MIGTTEIITIFGTLIALLLSGNIFFVKKLFEKIEATAAFQNLQAIQISKISESVLALGIQLRDIKLDVKDLRRVEIEFAVLRAQLNPVKASQDGINA